MRNVTNTSIHLEGEPGEVSFLAHEVFPFENGKQCVSLHFSAPGASFTIFGDPGELAVLLHCALSQVCDHITSTAAVLP